MKCYKIIVSMTVALSFLTLQTIKAAPVFSDSFSDPNGALIGQNPQVGGTWTITSTSVVNPIAVNNGLVQLTNTGQDVYAPFSSPVTLTDGQSLYIGLALNVSIAQGGGGEYFLHLTPNAGNTSLFFDRLFVESSGSGFVLGWLGTSGGVTNYGTTVLNLNTTYDVVVAYNYFAATTTSTTGAIYVNPTDPNVANDTAYMTSVWTSTSMDTNTLAAVNLRQGAAGTGPTLTVDNLAVSQTFGDVLVTPEPSTMALAAVGGIVCLFAVRRKR